MPALESAGPGRIPTTMPSDGCLNSGDLDSQASVRGEGDMLSRMTVLAALGAAGVGLVWGWVLGGAMVRAADLAQQRHWRLHTLQVVGTACLLLETAVLAAPADSGVLLLSAVLGSILRRICLRPVSVRLRVIE